jgi:hypothetical protein
VPNACSSSEASVGARAGVRVAPGEQALTITRSIRVMVKVNRVM